MSRPRGYWQNLENTIKETKAVMEKENWETLPNSITLREKGYSSLVNAIYGHYGGFYEFRKVLGEEQKRAKQGSLKELTYTLEQARDAMKKEGWKTLPSAKPLTEKGYSGLVSAIVRYQGGFHKFRKLLGEEQKRIKNGLWQNLDYTLEQARTAIEKENWTTLPHSGVLCEEGYSSLGAAIAKHHGGFHKFRKLLGEKRKQLPSGTWQDLDYTIKQARIAMKKENWKTLPSGQTLAENGYSSITYAILTYHRGFHKFRKLLAKSEGRPTEKEQLEALLKRYVHE